MATQRVYISRIRWHWHVFSALIGSAWVLCTWLACLRALIGSPWVLCNCTWLACFCPNEPLTSWHRCKSALLWLITGVTIRKVWYPWCPYSELYTEKRHTVGNLQNNMDVENYIIRIILQNNCAEKCSHQQLIKGLSTTRASAEEKLLPAVLTQWSRCGTLTTTACCSHTQRCGTLTTTACCSHTVKQVWHSHHHYLLFLHSEAGVALLPLSLALLDESTVTQRSKCSTNKQIPFVQVDEKLRDRYNFWSPIRYQLLH